MPILCFTGMSSAKGLGYETSVMWTWSCDRPHTSLVRAMIDDRELVGGHAHTLRRSSGRALHELVQQPDKFAETAPGRPASGVGPESEHVRVCPCPTPRCAFRAVPEAAIHLPHGER